MLHSGILVLAPAENKQVKETQTRIETSEKSDLFQLRHSHFSQMP
jgi:hypothetical protein